MKCAQKWQNNLVCMCDTALKGFIEKRDLPWDFLFQMTRPNFESTVVVCFYPINNSDFSAPFHHTVHKLFLGKPTLISFIVRKNGRGNDVELEKFSPSGSWLERDAAKRILSPTVL